MPGEKPTLTDEQVEQTIGRLLQFGVLLGATVVAVGGALYLVKYGADRPHYRRFHGETVDLRTFAGIVSDALAGRSRGIIQLGVLLLIATPVARVAFSVIAFVRERDRLYVVVTLIVLTTLCYSLFAGPR